MVAFGTSAPELAVSVASAYSGNADVAIGNVVGSNIFNILAVLGLPSLVGPDGVAIAAQALSVDIPVMIGVAVICLPIFFAGYVVTRWNGLLFMALYLVYVAYLVLDATDHGAVGPFSAVVVWGVVLLVALAFGIPVLRHFRASRNEAA